ncbi:integrase, catalytic region, zinc finger, CCHC-type containing protein [Tanacetum coccineum]
MIITKAKINIANQKKDRANIKKSKKSGSKKRLATPRPRKPRTCLRWSPTGRIFDYSEKIIDSSDSEYKSVTFVYDDASTSKPYQPTRKRFPNSTSLLGIEVCLWCVDSGYSKHMTGNLKLLINFVWKFMGTVHFGNAHVTAILDLEVAFRRSTYFVRNLEGVDLLKENRTTSLYTINLHEITSASPICLMAHVTSTKEFTNQVLKAYFEDVGISYQTSSVKTPQQNGVVEQRNQTLVEAARTMLIFSCASLFLWAEARATAWYTQNRSLIHQRFDKTPYELINDRKLDISFLHVFGALCYPKNDREDIRKLGTKGDIGFFIGYSATLCVL